MARNARSLAPSRSSGRGRIAASLATLTAIVGLIGSRVPVSAAELRTTRISVSSSEQQADPGDDPFEGWSERPAISADGRFVAFESTASNLVAGDTNERSDVFVRDRLRGTTRRVSVSSAEVQGNSMSIEPAISADGRFVAFTSLATNLVGQVNPNNSWDVYVRDRHRGTTRRVSVSSAEGVGDATSWKPAISADGRFVAFVAYATNLVPGDTNGGRDAFVRDLARGTTTRVSVSSSEAQSDPGIVSTVAISGDGRFVAFDSTSTNLVEGDGNNAQDVFVRDRLHGTTRRMSVTSSEGPANSDSYGVGISADGRFVSYDSDATNLALNDTNGTTDVFVRDRLRGTTRRVSLSSTEEEAPGGGFSAAISPDGRFIVFAGGPFVDSDTSGFADIYRRDRREGTTRLISVSSSGELANSQNGHPVVSEGGRFVAFDSRASNLVPFDTNERPDVFVRGPFS